MSSKSVHISSKDSANNQVAAEKTTETDRLARARAVAVQHALSIEEKKNIHDRVLDMILTAYDLPADDSADPASPDPTDVATFRSCLALFRPVDLDEVVSERNIDERCGYALCRQPNPKKPPKKVWDSRGRLVEKKTDTQWCSKECKSRNEYVRRQLSEEPAWLRLGQTQHVVLMTDKLAVPIETNSTMTILEGTKPNSIRDDQIEERDTRVGGDTNAIAVIERETTKVSEPPGIAYNEVLEGLPIGTIGKVR